MADRRLAKAIRQLGRVHTKMTPPRSVFEPTPIQTKAFETLVVKLDTLSKKIKKVGF